MPTRSRVEWKGDELKPRFYRAVARGTIGVAEQIAARAKRNVHVISGDLRRSIHVAAVNTSGEVPASQGNVLRRTGAIVEVGSWLEYAGIEETRDQQHAESEHSQELTSHAYMIPALESVRGTAFRTYKAAFRQEGLI